MRKLYGMFAVFLCFFLFCSRASAQGEELLVTRVDVDYKESSQSLIRHYSGQEKMMAILNFLRLCKFDGMPADNPEDHAGSSCQILLTLAGGGHRAYYLHDERYLSKGGRPWEKIRPPGSLRALLLALPSDA